MPTENHCTTAERFTEHQHQDKLYEESRLQSQHAYTVPEPCDEISESVALAKKLVEGPRFGRALPGLPPSSGIFGGGNPAPPPAEPEQEPQELIPDCGGLRGAAAAFENDVEWQAIARATGVGPEPGSEMATVLSSAPAVFLSRMARSPDGVCHWWFVVIG